MLTDIQIAQDAQLKEITQVLPEYKDIIESYGKYMAKISYTNIDEDKVKKSKLILVTSITPTKAGIGKTTVSVGLNDGLRKLGKNSMAVLREPSLGPCFGMKGGACGGGYSQVVPMEKINLHFTGDFHAITSANNMLAAALDNYLYQNPDILDNVKRITFKRCIDINDRSLRDIYYKIRKNNEFITHTGFNITPASELMAIFCLAKDIDDLRKRIDNITLAEMNDGSLLKASRLQITGSLVALLSDAFKPNLVQSLENNPVLIHGGPFANIAHGCNSIIATKLGMTLSNYVVTEAGFGSDLGAQKFLDIKCRNAEIWPHCIVLVVTIKGLKQFTGNLVDGFQNLQAHYNHLKMRSPNVIITYNAHIDDTPEDVSALLNYCKTAQIECVKNSCFVDGGNGALDLATAVVNKIDINPDIKPVYTYSIIDDIWTKIRKILVYVYGYNKDVNIVMNSSIERKLNNINQWDNAILYNSYDICIAKTQYSMNDEPDIIPITSNKNTFTITDVEVNTGAKMIIISAGNMMRMPGLPKSPQAERIDFNEDKIINLS